MRIVIKMLSDRKIYVPILQIEYEERIVDNNKLIEPTTDISYKVKIIIYIYYINNYCFTFRLSISMKEMDLKLSQPF